MRNKTKLLALITTLILMSVIRLLFLLNYHFYVSIYKMIDNNDLYFFDTEKMKDNE